jgi:hypothetical protein
MPVGAPSPGREPAEGIDEDVDAGGVERAE